MMTDFYFLAKFASFKMRTTFVLFFLLLFLVKINAQSILSGLILTQDEKPLEGIQVKEMGRSNYTTTDYYGNFKLRITSAESTVIISHPEYDSLELVLNVAKFHKIFLKLRINGNPYNLAGNVGSHDFRHKLPAFDWETMPYLFGEADVNRKLQLLPGIEQGVDGFSNLYVRGGSNDQNLYLYNGIPIYNYNQLFGLTSIFNINGLENVEVDKGISSARFGGRLSSVIQLQPNRRQMFDGLTGSFDVSILSIGIFLQNNVGKDGHFSLSARRSYVDFFLPTEMRENSFNVVFHDINLNYAQKVNKGRDLFEFSLINARTKINIGFEIPPDTSISPTDTSIRPSFGLSFGIKTKTNAGIVKLTQQYNRKFSGVYSIYASHYSLQDELKIIPSTGPTTELISQNSILDVGISADYSFFQDNRSTWYFGIQNSIKSYNFGFIEATVSNTSVTRDNVITTGQKGLQPTVETALYAENRYRLTANAFLDWGGRMVIYSGLGGSYLRFEPRVNYTNKIHDRTYLKIAFNTHHQFVHLLNNGNVGGMLNLWVPSTELIKPSSSHIASIGLDHIFDKKTALQITAYGKLMNNLVIASDIYEALNPESDWQSSVTVGSGQSAGIEVMLMRNNDNVNSFVSYTFSHANRTFEELFANQFLFQEDRPHMFKFASSTEVTEDFQFGVIFMYGSGRLFTIPNGRYLDMDGNYVLETNTFNNYRSPNFSRLDINVSWHRMSGIYRIGVYNVLASKNTANVFPEFNAIRFTNVKLYREYYFIFTPMISYSLEF